MIRRRSAGGRVAALILFLAAVAGGGTLGLYLNDPDRFVIRLGAGGHMGSAPISTEAMPGAQQQDPTAAPPPESRFEVIALRPLFNPDRLAPEEEAAPAPETDSGSLPDMVVTGIIMAGDDSVAILEPSRRGSKGQRLMLRKGDTVSGWTLETIEADRILLSKGEESGELVLKKDESPAQRQPNRQPNAQQNQQRQRVIPPAQQPQQPARR